MKIVNVRGLPANSPGITYVGRACAGWTGSPLGNPFTLRRGAEDWERDEAIFKYRLWLATQVANRRPAILKALTELTEESVLGCWCHPANCHASVIIEAWQKLRPAPALQGEGI